MCSQNDNLNTGECGIKPKKIPNTQKSLFDLANTVERDKKLNDLSIMEVGIGRGLINGEYQALIAKKLAYPKASVNRIVKMYERMSLISHRTKSYTHKNKKYTLCFDDILDNRRKTYDVSPLLEAAIEKAETEVPGDCMCAVHNVGVKVAVTRINGESSRKKNLSERIIRDIPLNNIENRKITFVRTYQPRGPPRHVFSVETSSILCTIVVHGNTITAQWSTGAKVRAKDPVSARRIVEEQVIEALRAFITSQCGLGLHIEHTPPQPYTQPHYAFPSRVAKYIQSEGGQLHVGGVQIDGSPIKKGFDYGDIEIHGDGDLAGKVDRSLKNALQIDTIIDEKLGKLKENLLEGCEVPNATTISDIVAGAIADTLSESLGKIVEQKIMPLIKRVELAQANIAMISDPLTDDVGCVLTNVGQTHVPLPVAIDGTLTPWVDGAAPRGVYRSDICLLNKTVRDLRAQVAGMFDMLTEILHGYRKMHGNASGVC